MPFRWDTGLLHQGSICYKQWYILSVYMESPMETAKLFMSGNSQAVRLPKSYRFSGDEVVIKRLGNGVVLLPKEDPWQVMFDALQDFPVDLQLERDQSLPVEREPIV
ncbi:antitoxin [Coleofasciculus chthonoplastes]|jgi:antitoxin VapB|uniref:antitoxin n=2 Tax=Coleofasciculaceae TaxID=1892251 RepID=UPI0032F55AE2